MELTTSERKIVTRFRYFYSGQNLRFELTPFKISHYFVRIHAEFASPNKFHIDVFLVSLTHERRFLSSKSCSSLETLAANSPDG